LAIAGQIKKLMQTREEVGEVIDAPSKIKPIKSALLTVSATLLCSALVYPSGTDEVPVRLVLAG